MSGMKSELKAYFERALCSAHGWLHALIVYASVDVTDSPGNFHDRCDALNSGNSSYSWGGLYGDAHPERSPLWSLHGAVRAIRGNVNATRYERGEP